MDKEIETIKKKVNCGYLRVDRLIALTDNIINGKEFLYEGEMILIECAHPKLNMFGCLVNDGKECPYRSLESNDAVDKQDNYIPF